MKKIYIEIQADTNDGDYVSERTEIDTETLKKITPVVQAISDFKPYNVKTNGIDWNHSNNFPNGDCCREDLGQLSAEEYYVGKKLVEEEEFREFEELIPYGEYGIHTIVSVVLLHVEQEVQLLK